MQKLVKIFLSGVLTLSVFGCNPIDFSKLTQKPFDSLSFKASPFSLMKNSSEEIEKTKDIGTIISDARPRVKLDESFINSLNLAVKSDPRVMSARQDYEARLASIEFVRGEKEFQVSGTIYGGVEDITDETVGLAAVLSARRMLYDGGAVEKSISAEESISKAAYQNMLVEMNDSAFESASAWVELERYETLNTLISSRLAVLDPLISQLEQVADAGVGDKSQVAAAQRTVAMIRVAQSDLAERLELAKVNFTNMFGALPAGVTFDADLVSAALPSDLGDPIVLKSPALIGGYETYLAAIARLEAVLSKADFSVGFETKIQRPFGGSNYDSDESVGLVVRKTLYDGKKQVNEAEKAKIAVDSAMSKLQATYREGKRVVENAQQTIIALGSAMNIAADNAKASAEEISFLRKQLIIGQSTLDSVLAAEARLYDAESKEIQFLADQRLAELSVLSTLGLLVPIFGLE